MSEEASVNDEEANVKQEELIVNEEEAIVGEFNELDGEEILQKEKETKEEILDEEKEANKEKVEDEKSDNIDSENDWNYYYKYFQDKYGGGDEEEALDSLLRLPTSSLGIDEIPLDFYSDQIEEEEELLDIDKVPIIEKDSFELLDTTSLLKGVSKHRIRRETIVATFTEGEEEEEVEKPDESVLQLFEKKEVEDIDFGAQIIEMVAVQSEETIQEEFRIYEEQESEESKISEVEVPLDREALIEDYKTLINGRYIARRRNFLLKRRLAEHFKRRHMEHAYKEIITPADLEDRYERKLIAFRELDTETTETKYMIKDQVEELTSQKIKAKEETKEKFEELLARELEIGLTISKQGSGISDTTVKTLVDYKRTKAWQLSKIRLISIEFKEKIKEAENKRLALECIGRDLRLMDYEEMQIEFNNFMDKTDERIEQMVRLREKVCGDVQIMAHMRERYFAQNDDILDLQRALLGDKYEITTLRRKVNRLVRKRGDIEYQTIYLKNESGLLTYNNLLKDFQNTLNKIDEVMINLYLIQETYQEHKPLLMASRQAVDALKSGKQVNQFIEEEKREDQHSSLNEDSLVKMVSGYSNLLPSYNLAPNGKYRN